MFLWRNKKKHILIYFRKVFVQKYVSYLELRFCFFFKFYHSPVIQQTTNC